MKALSLKQPYAELVVAGRKIIELRNWRTNFRGEFYIHASGTLDKEAMERFGFDYLPTGCIIGRAVLIDVKEYETKEEHERDRDKHLADSSWGNYGFVLERATRIEPVICKGALNFWNVDPALEARIKAENPKLI